MDKKIFFLVGAIVILSGLAMFASVEPRFGAGLARLTADVAELAGGEAVPAEEAPATTPEPAPVAEEPVSTEEAVAIATGSEEPSLLEVALGTTTATATDPESTPTASLISRAFEGVADTVSSLLGSAEEESVATTTTPTPSPTPVLSATGEVLPPEGEIISPIAGASIGGGVVTVKLRITNPGSGVGNVLFYLSDDNGILLGETGTPDEEGFYSVRWNTANTDFSNDGRPHYVYAAILGAEGGSSNPPWVPINVRR